ncbi:MAG: hypothetical protein IK099_05205 [Clostridia bacterium]|nr:hypothetical protein [Clostridia bacterium]
MENLPLGWFSAKGGPEGPGQAAVSRFLYQFATVKRAFSGIQPGKAFLQQIDGSIERLLSLTFDG